VQAVLFRRFISVRTSTTKQEQSKVVTGSYTMKCARVKPTEVVSFLFAVIIFCACNTSVVENKFICTLKGI
jgi:hypothetical protein